MPRIDGNLRVLIAEDHKSSYLVLCKYLKDAFGEDTKIQWAESADDAVQLLIGEAFDVCLLDYSLENGDATDILESVASEFFDTPTIIISAHEDDEHVSQAMRAGADNFLVKGRFDADELARTIRYSIYGNARIREEKRRRQTLRTEALGRLVGGVAHELNNLLLPILSLTQMTMKQLPEGGRERLKLEKVVEASERARDLISRMMMFGSQKEDTKLEEVDAFDVIQEAVDLLKSMVLSNVEVRSRLEKSAGQVMADADEIKTAIINLGINSTDAIKKTGTIKVELSRVQVDEKLASSVSNLKPGSHVRISMSDTGSGMDEETLQRVFDPFFTTKEVGEGTGLGLSMVQGIVARHNGAINIMSEVGRGTTVEIFLPQIGAEVSGQGTCP